MDYVHRISFFFVVAALSSCASSQLRIESQPEAADVLLTVQGQPPRKLGVTPYVLDEATLGLRKASYQLSIQKTGFQSDTILIPASIVDRQSLLNVSLVQAAESESNPSAEGYQALASGIAQSQDYIKSKNYELAEKTLTSLLVKFPSVATIHELLGNTYYLRRDVDRALTAYKRAQELAPNNLDTQRMIQKLQPIRSTGSSGGQ